MSTRLPESDWSRLDALFDEALELPPGARHAFLERVGTTDPSVRARIEALLAADEAAGSFMSGGADQWLRAAAPPSAADTEDATLTAGRHVGPYRVVREIGRGGMGVVYQAERADGEFDQRVALKLVRYGLDSQETLARFRRERQILARLDHPSIARLFDGGVHSDGRPWFAMELVDGEPITAYCDREQMSVRARVRLFERVCEAVQYAHANLVVHRDLKPSNILVTASGDLKLLDFGIAKAINEEGEADARDVTRAGLRLLTPAYAAPEQLRGEPVSTATDVFALGVILFELLTGVRPFGSSGSSAAELERAVLDDEPPRPSAAVARRANASGSQASADAAARTRGVAPATLRALLAGDLDAIVLKALRKEPLRRYGSAAALAEDLERYHEGQPVSARPEGRRYRATKFARRHRVGIAVAALFALSLVGGLAATAWQARATAREARKAEAVKEFLISVFQLADPVQAAGREISLRQVLDRGADRVQRELAGQPAVQAELLTVLSGIYAELGVLDRAAELTTQALQIHERLHGPESEPVGINLRQQAGLAIARGDAAAGEDLARRALAIHRQARGDAPREVAESLDVLVMALRQRGRSSQALPLAEESLSIRRAVYGAEHRLVADSMNNRAVLLREQGRYDEAATLYRQVLELRRRLLGDDHPHVALALHNFSTLQHFRGEYQDAAALSQEAIAAFRRLYGDDHALTLAARSTRAAVDRFLGRFEEAEADFRSILGAWRRTQGEDHPNAMVTLGGLGRLRRERGDLREAEEILRGLDVRWRERMGTKHPTGAMIRRQLGGVLTDTGQYDDAEAFLRDSLQMLRAAYGAAHPEVAETLHELTLLARARGDLAGAETLGGEALAIRRERLGPRHVLTAQSLAALGAVRLARSDHVGARTALEEAVEILEAALPAGHPMRVSAAGELARARAREAAARR
jgi:serine/threonine-protein kinase